MLAQHSKGVYKFISFCVVVVCPAVRPQPNSLANPRTPVDWRPFMWHITNNYTLSVQFII